jgi:hypothetical protein
MAGAERSGFNCGESRFIAEQSDFFLRQNDPWRIGPFTILANRNAIE